LEQLVADLLGACLRDRDRIARMVVQVDPKAVEATTAAAHQLAASSRIRGLGISRIDVRDDRVDVQVDASTLLRACGLEAATDDQPNLMLSAAITRIRRGHELKLIVPSETSEPETPRNKKLVRLLADAMEVQKLVLGSPDRLLNDIAAAHGRCRKRLTKLLRISWLAPEIMQSILDGKQPANLTTSTLLNGDLPLSWSEQVSALS
jgi:site-specific DNA recombinase